MKVKTSIANNQLIVLEKYVKKTHYCRKKLVVIAKNNAKQRMYSSFRKVEEIELYLKKILSEEHYYNLFQNMTVISREK